MYCLVVYHYCFARTRNLCWFTLPQTTDLAPDSWVAKADEFLESWTAPEMAVNLAY